MDEIQEIPQWSMWVRRINETTEHRLFFQVRLPNFHSMKFRHNLVEVSIVDAFIAYLQKFLAIIKMLKNKERYKVRATID